MHFLYYFFASASYVHVCGRILENRLEGGEYVCVVCLELSALISLAV